MKPIASFLGLCLLTQLASTCSAAGPSPDPYANETPAQRDARMKWWREARFGMFIHWGVYSVPAGTYNGRRIDGIGEWIMHNAKIPVADYKAYARQFNPVKYDPDAWVRLARQAGMKYIVITSKHHDGFALFDSKATDWDVVGATPYGMDLLKPLAAACRRHGLKLGFYYSQAQDWNNGGSAAGGKWDLAQQRSMDDYLDKIAVPQVKEILTHYGEFPAVLWWDTPVDMNPDRAAKLIALLKLKPGIIHNNRLGGGYRGDTETPEQTIPATGYPGRDWETCMTMNDTWGYKSYDQNWKPVETLIRNLVDIASKGGNYLLNVGPTSEGLIPGPSVERLQAVGQWMKVNGDAIYATSASPFRRLPWGRCTVKAGRSDTTLYLHVFNWPADGKLVVPGLQNDVVSARVLATGKRLETAKSDRGLTLNVPAKAPDPISSTLVLRIKGQPDVITPEAVLTQAADGTVQLKAEDATLHGATIQYEAEPSKNCLGWWTDAEDWADWKFKVTKSGRFQVIAEIAALGAGRFVLEAGSQSLHGVAPVTGDYTRFQRLSLGTLELPAGAVSLRVRPVRDGWQPMNLRAVALVPNP